MAGARNLYLGLHQVSISNEPCNFAQKYLNANKYCVKHFCMLTITKVTKRRNSKVMFDKFIVVGICTSVNYEWIWDPAFRVAASFII